MRRLRLRRRRRRQRRHGHAVGERKTVAEGRLEKTVPIHFSTDDTFDVGEDWGTPVSSTYTPPFTFTGTQKKVTVQTENQ